MGRKQNHLDDTASELAAYKATVAELDRIFTAAATGDLDPRAMDVANAADFAELSRLRSHVNHTLDLMDAFTREAAAALTSAAQGNSGREFLEAGMPGTFRSGAHRINEGRRAIEKAHHANQDQQERRDGLAVEFEDHVLGLAEEMSTATAQVDMAGQQLQQVAAAVADEVGRASTTIAELSSASEEIQAVTVLIDHIAAQTKLLALNATIEAARVGEAGKGFAVVAGEVKELAGQTSEATQRVSEQIEQIVQHSTEAVEVISGVGLSVEAMTDTMNSMATAVRGDTGTDGLTESTSRLRNELQDFLRDIRSDG